MERKKLDRLAWHTPLISVVVTHYNYSDHIRDALLSLLDQTHARWQCVVVDDASESGHRQCLQAIVSELNEPRIQIRWLAANGGQIPAFFAGLEVTQGEFICLLDPDDRYAETFLAEALACHLNEAVYCPLVCTEQMLLRETGLMTGIYGWRNRLGLRQDNGALIITPEEPQLLYYEAGKGGWHWTSTSAMMFRRAALQLLRPQRALAYKGSFDSYMAQGAHLLGGTLFYTKPLVYRGLHHGNAWITADVYASCQNKQKTYGEERTAECLKDVIEALAANGASLLRGQPLIKKRGLLAKWKRSIDKRFGRIASFRRSRDVAKADCLPLDKAKRIFFEAKQEALKER